MVSFQLYLRILVLVGCTLLQLHSEERVWKVLKNTGPAEKRLDVALMAVGYSARQQGLAEKRAQQVVAALQEIEPFTNYRKYINFYLTLLNEKDSELVSVRLSSLNILACDREQALQLSESAPDADIVMVLTNEPEGRSTAHGKVITLASKGGLDDVFIHEMGHAFGLLADEYEDPVMARERDLDEADRWVNTTQQSNPLLSKWHYWTINKWFGAHMMMDLPSGHRITHKEGAFYVPKGVFRPENNCKMRDHRFSQFCVVCAEEIEKQFFIHIDPLQNYWPTTHQLSVWNNETLKFGATIIDVKASGGKVGKFVTTWYLDGQHIVANNNQKNTEITLNAQQLEKGSHELALRVDFVNGNVRKDNGWLSSSIVWSISVNEFAEPLLRLKSPLKISLGQTVKVEKDREFSSSENCTLSWQGLPPGAWQKDQDWSWTLPENTYGAWEVNLLATLGGKTKSKSGIIFSSRNVNRMPTLQIPEILEVTPGRAFEQVLVCNDPDGDALTLEIEGMPAGMEYDPQLKVLRWVPTATFTSCPLKITVFDGSSRTYRNLELRLNNHVRSEEEKIGDDIALRSPVPQTRFKALLLTSNQSISAQLLHCNRLLRDSEDIIANQASRWLSKILANSPQYRDMFFKDLEPYLWDLCDRPKTLTWLKELAQQDGKKKDNLLKTIALIENYNLNRGLR